MAARSGLRWPLARCNFPQGGESASRRGVLIRRAADAVERQQFDCWRHQWLRTCCPMRILLSLLCIHGLRLLPIDLLTHEIIITCNHSGGDLYRYSTSCKASQHLLPLWHCQKVSICMHLTSNVWAWSCEILTHETPWQPSAAYWLLQRLMKPNKSLQAFSAEFFLRCAYSSANFECGNVAWQNIRYGKAQEHSKIGAIACGGRWCQASSGT